MRWPAGSRRRVDYTASVPPDPYPLLDEPAAVPTARGLDHFEEPPVRRRPLITTVFLAFWLLVMVGLGVLRWHHPGLDHGDPTTDANILNGGDNFARDGVWRSYGVPAIDTFRAPGHMPDYYVTYPPGAYWFHHILRSVGVGSGGSSSPAAFRIASLAVSGISVLLLFALLTRLTRDAAPAAVACVLYMLSKPFLEYADALHYLSLSQAALMLALYAWVRCDDAAEEGLRSSALAWFLVTLAAFFADSWLTFEHALFVPAFAAVRTNWLRRWPRLLGVAVLVAVPAIVLAIRLVMNRAVLGSFEAVFAIMRGKFDQRIGSSAGGTGLETLWHAWLPRLGWSAGSPGLPGDHPDAEFGLPLLGLGTLITLGLLAMLLVASWHLRGAAPMRRMLGAGAALAIGGLTWFMAMTEHAISHRFTVMLILPAAAALAGTLVAAGLAQPDLHAAGGSGRRPRVIVRLIGPLLAVAAIVCWCLPLRSSFAVNTLLHADGSVRDALQRRAEARAAFTAASGQLRDVSHLLMLRYDAPAARALGRPFDNSIARSAMEPPTTLHTGQALLAPLWSPDAGAACVRLVDALGLPTMLSPVLGPYLLFHGASPASAPAGPIATARELQLRRAEWKRTTDQQGWVLVMLANGPIDALAAANATLVLRGEQAPGQFSRLVATPLRAAARDGNQVLITMTIPDTAVSAVSRVELRLLASDRRRPHPWTRPTGDTDSASPAGPQVIDGSLSWPAPPWRSRPAPAPPVVER